MTRDTLIFLLDLLGRQQMVVGAADFETVVTTVIQAKTELLEALNPADSPRPII